MAVNETKNPENLYTESETLKNPTLHKHKLVIHIISMIIGLKRLELLLWTVTPACITFLLFILYTIPKHLWGMNYIMPLLPLLPIFYWGRLHAPEIPYWFVFLIGLLMDVVSGTPLGLSAMLYLLFLTMLQAQSKYIHKEGFIIVWFYFAFLLSIICALQWIVLSFPGNFFHTITPVFMQWIVTTGSYPLFHKLFDRLADHISHRHWIILHA